MSRGTHSGNVSGSAYDGDLCMHWTVWCEMDWYWLPADIYGEPPWSPEEYSLEINEVHEAQLEVTCRVRGEPLTKSIVFYLYDYDSLLSFLELWGVDIQDALESWEPDA